MVGLSESVWAEEKDNRPTRRGSRGRRNSRPARSLSPPPFRQTLNSGVSKFNDKLSSSTSQFPNLPASQSVPHLPLSRGTIFRDRTPVAPRAPSPKILESEFSRFLKIVARLNWKLPFLKQGYNLAKDGAGKSQQETEAAEVQFKLDFHEFYMFLERALVRLMAIYGITVDGDSFWMSTDPVNLKGLAASRHSGRYANHQFHVNVLRALEDPRNPLNSIFGSSEVRYQLTRAKDLRNRWKNIDEVQERVPPPPLAAYNLDLMVQTILAAIERAHDLVVDYIRANGGEVVTTSTTQATGGAKQDWDFMVDAMDWEKV
ncbi:hypothetical protein F4819DRAFT_441373 [Hypoxylon fuscum]|nr:hypothetical protein F4819DRAFT_441373 [Hypoxylon fuscum]